MQKHEFQLVCGTTQTGSIKKFKISFFAHKLINDLFSWETNVPRSELCYIIEERYDKSRVSKPQQSN